MFHPVPLLHTLYHTSLSTTIFITMAITMERFHAVCYPTDYRVRMTIYGQKKLVLLYIIPAIGCALLFNIPQVKWGLKHQSSLSLIRINYWLINLSSVFWLQNFWLCFHTNEEEENQSKAITIFKKMNINNLKSVQCCHVVIFLMI